MAQGADESDDDTSLLFVEGGLIEVGITINQLLGINLMEETFQVEFDLHLVWTDPRLQGWKSRIWLQDGSALPKGMKQNCQTKGKCVCGAEQAGAKCRGKLDFVEGCYQERDGKFLVNVEGFPEKELTSWMLKEEPPFEKLGAGGVSSLLAYSTTAEEIQVLSEYQHLIDGVTGKRKQFQKIAATFKENMELKRFPFDRQELKFKIRSNVHTVTLKRKASSCLSKDLPEYTVLKDKLGFCDATPFAGRNGRTYQKLQVTILVERMPHKYLVNVVLMTYILVLASFSYMAFDLQQIGDRIGIILTSVLASMALKFVITDHLPGKSYQTWLDLYLLAAYLMLTMPALELLILSLSVKLSAKNFKHEEYWETSEKIDWYFTCLIFIIWNISHLYFVVRSALNGGYQWLRLSWSGVEKCQDDKDTIHGSYSELKSLLACEASSEESDDDEEP
eukprot:TRINITY_DN92113_c0_g1_i1.p1 TRINITY_DN92113_c0_g1~~TRINITY_DN92113_c0_g1_i1.p1  ORF type:complete len:460 (+),score=88.12 TRINITY_DN92113_c0_g1_i1:39-1382(+)